MNHLVESHMGGYYISEADPEIIEAYCEQCGEHDYIIFSYETEEEKMEKLKDHFTSTIKQVEYIKESIKYASSVDEIIEDIDYDYDNNKYMVEALFEEKIINKNEKGALFKQINLVKKNQLAILRNTVAPNDIKVLKKGNNKQV